MEMEARMEEPRIPLGLLTASQQNGEPAAPLDFSKLTSSQFGITPDSFTAFPKHKDKSRVSQLKARRRSTVGVRGSPETNSLIRFRAKQAMKTPPRTPQRLLESPLFSPCDSIKQKMAAFQRLMGTDEEEGEEGGQTQSDVGGGCEEEQENRLVSVTPPLSKRRCRGTPHRVMWEEPIKEEMRSEIAYSLEHKLQVDSSESPVIMPSLGLNSQAQLLSLPMLSKPEIINSGDAEFPSVSTKKRVRFGAPLSPEFFDKTLPPSTPLQKGATPVAPPLSTGPKHSLLKTPQRFKPPLLQPDFGSPERASASPMLTAFSPCTGGADCDEVFLDNQKISFPIMDEEYDNPQQDTEAQESPDEHSKIISSTSQEEKVTPPPSFSADPLHSALPSAAEHVDQCRPSDSADSSTKAPRARGRKRKQQAESETIETRKSSRSAAVSAKGKLKTASSSKKRFGSKEVDRSLYGKRDYASKNPLLSPIIESTASSLSSTPTRGHRDTSSPATDKNPAPGPVPALGVNRSEAVPPDATSDLVAAAALWRRRFLHEAKNEKNDTKLTDSSELSGVQSETTVESTVLSACKHVRSNVGSGHAGRGRRNSASPHRRSEPVVRDQKINEFCPSETQEFNQEQEPAGETSFIGKSKARKSLRKTMVKGPGSTWTKAGTVSEEEERIEELIEAEGMCRDTVESSGNEREAVERNKEELRQNQGPGEHAKNMEESTPFSLPLETLESWQQPDFCIEDVLRPLAKTRSSVRRSLRHRASVDVLAKGLAWVEHTSPQAITTTQRRRTRGRLSAVSQPPSCPTPEEPSSER